MLTRIIILTFLFCFLIGSVLIDPVLGLTKIQQNTLSLLFVAMILWISKVVPTGISSLGIIGLQLLLGIASDFKDAVQGFLFTPIYFMLAVALLNKVLIKVELDKKISRFFLYNTRGKIKQIAWRFFLATILMPIIFPSATARLQMFIPFMEKINQRHQLPENSSFVRFTIWTLSGLNQLSTLVVFTGGGFAVLSFQLLTELGYQLTWVSWFLLMAPPIWLTCFILVMIMFKFYLSNTSIQKEHLSHNQKHIIQSKPSSSKSKKHFWFVFTVLFLLISCWIIGPWIQLTTIVPILLSLILFSLPGVRLLDNKDLHTHDWENFLLLGSALSLSVSIESNGTAKWISDFIFSVFDKSQNDFINLLIVMLIVLIIRCLFVSPSGAITVIYPLIITFADTLGLNSLYLFLITILLICGFMVHPMSSPITILAYETGYIKLKEHIFLGLCALVTTISMTIICYYFYWPLIY